MTDSSPDETADEAADEAALEAFAEKNVQQALAPYRGHFPPEVIEEWEDDLRCFLLTHPVAYEMLARIRPHVRAVSGNNGVAPMPHQDVSAAGRGKVG